jgi:hypothetical protein
MALPGLQGNLLVRLPLLDSLFLPFLLIFPLSIFFLFLNPHTFQFLVLCRSCLRSSEETASGICLTETTMSRGGEQRYWFGNNY